MSGKITAIERAAEGLPLTVYIDGRAAFDVSEEMAARLGLEVGMEFAGGPSRRDGADGQRADPDRDEERARAREASFRLLAVRARSERELGDRLRRKGFAPITIEETLRSLTSAGLLDDLGFAKAWADERVRLKPVGPLRLRQELVAKGVPPAVVDKVVGETYHEHDELELATKALLRRVRGGRPSRQEETKLNAFLLRRGFSYEVAALAVRELMAGGGETSQGGGR